MPAPSASPIRTASTSAASSLRDPRRTRLRAIPRRTGPPRTQPGLRPAGVSRHRTAGIPGVSRSGLSDVPAARGIRRRRSRRYPAPPAQGYSAPQARPAATPDPAVPPPSGRRGSARAARREGAAARRDPLGRTGCARGRDRSRVAVVVADAVFRLRRLRAAAHPGRRRGAHAGRSGSSPTPPTTPPSPPRSIGSPSAIGDFFATLFSTQLGGDWGPWVRRSSRRSSSCS